MPGPSRRKKGQYCAAPVIAATLRNSAASDNGDGVSCTRCSKANTVCSSSPSFRNRRHRPLLRQTGANSLLLPRSLSDSLTEGIQGSPPPEARTATTDESLGASEPQSRAQRIAISDTTTTKEVIDKAALEPGLGGAVARVVMTCKAMRYQVDSSVPPEMAALSDESQRGTYVEAGRRVFF